ncbi:hypothetical protein [Streptomyces sp. N35]|uniref:hypothetical protein n=1 Tax=Streptomyces sp. N35 TaxID=2795730 RepID=UPI0018F77C1D|nr:hypothetical protein [Streptomyces sp. N35]
MDDRPQLWFRLPPGYQEFDPAGLTPIRERAPEWAPALDEIFRHGTFYAALGLHRTDVYEAVTTSLFTLSSTSTLVSDPQVAAARALISREGWVHWTPDTCELRTVARTTAAAFTTGVLRCDDEGAATVCQATCTFLIPGTPTLITATLTSSDLTQSEAYTDILGAVASTISFEEPKDAPAGRQPTSRIAELIT